MEKTINKDLKRGEIAGLIRDMDIGDILRFPITKHNTVRNVPYNSLLAERAEGYRWTVNADIANKQTVVTRVS